MKKVRKDEKQNVNGAGDVQYVWLEFETSRVFYGMFRVRGENLKFALNFAVDKWTFRKKILTAPLSQKENLIGKRFAADV